MRDDFHPQDSLLIAEALLNWAGQQSTQMTPRRERAWHLAEKLVTEQGLDMKSFYGQVDHDYPERITDWETRRSPY